MNKTSSKKRILMLLENCGMPEDSRVRNEAIALAEQGFDVTVVCPTSDSRKTYEQFQGIHLYRYPAPFELPGFIGYLWEFGYSMFMMFWFTAYLLFRRGFDAIHVHSPPDMNSWVAVFFKIFAGKKYVLDTHDLSPELYDAQRDGKGSRLVKSGLQWFERQAVRWADRLIATNETQKQIQIERGGADPKRCYVVRNGPTDAFLEDNIIPTQQLPRETRVLIGYVGVIGVQDGVDSMIRALHALKTTLNFEDFMGVIVGDGPAKEDLMKLSAELKMESHIQFTGMIDYSEVPSYIAAFDICVTPDPSNPYNDSCTTIKTMEYMAVGRPTVAFETKENQLTALDSALYAAQNTSDALADQIFTLIKSPELRESLGKKARQRAKNVLSWGQQKLNLIEVYQDLFGLEKTNSELTHSKPIHDEKEKIYVSG